MKTWIAQECGGELQHRFVSRKQKPCDRGSRACGLLFEYGVWGVYEATPRFAPCPVCFGPQACHLSPVTA